MMKKISLLLVAMLMAASFCEAKVYTGRLNTVGSRGHKSKVVKASKNRCSEVSGCRVSSMNNPAFYNMAGIYIQAKTGYMMYPMSSFDWSLALGLKTYIGLTAGVYVNSQVGQYMDWSGGVYLNYEFASLRARTKLFYPVIGIDCGLAGLKEIGHNPSIHTKLGYKVGFNFVTVRDILDIGVEYQSNWRFIDQSSTRYPGGCLDHSVGIVTRVYIF